MSKALTKTVRGVVGVGAAHFTIALSAYLISVVLARTLGPAQFGIYGLIVALLLATEVVLQFGVPVAISKLVAERPHDEHSLVSTGLLVVLACYCTVFVAVWICAPWLATVFEIPDSSLIRIAALDLPFYGAFLLFENLLSGRRDFDGKTMVLFAYGMTKAIGVCVLAVGGLTIAGALLVNVTASIVGASVALWRGKPTLGSPHMAAARQIGELAIRVAILDIGLQCLLNVDLWCMNVLSNNVDPASLGHYVAAKSLARIPMMVSLVLNAILLPSLARGVAAGEHATVLRFLTGTTQFLALALVPACALVAVEGAGIMSLMYSNEYRDGGDYLALLIFGNGLLYTVFSILLNILLAVGNHRTAARIAIASIVAAGLTNAVLVPFFGIEGAALSTIVAAAFAVTATAIAVYRRLGPLLEWSFLVKVIGLTTCMCIVAGEIHTQGVMLIVEMAGLMIAFALLSAWLGLLDKNLIALLRKQPT
jgi:O-antigen/teichoic acid export membrane protein